MVRCGLPLLFPFHHGPPPKTGGIAKDKLPLAHRWGAAVGQRGTTALIQVSEIL